MARATTLNRRSHRKGGEDLPEWLPRATEFSDDPELLDPVWVIEQVARFPQIFDDLREESDLEAHYGRKRVEGNWALIMLAFVLSNNVDVEPFCRRYRSSPIWSVAGFARMPSVQTVWARLTELEKDPAPFVKAASKLIQQAVRHEPRIIENVWVDATSFETHAALEHCCESRSACIAAGGRPPRFVKRAGEQLVEEERHRDAAEPPNGRTRASGALEEVPGTAPIDEKPSRRKREYRYFMIGKHRYRTLDPDAGARTYKNGRTWFGGYNQSAISMFVGAPLANNIFSASENEHTQWPKLLRRLKEATGGITPQAAIFDRGYSIESTFELNTREGISSIMPFRQPNPQTRREDLSTEAVDMHGVPRCKHCGGPGDQDGPELGFYFDRGVVPRIRFRCELQLTPACKGKQSIACEESWRLLLPTSRFTRRYHTLKKAGENKERNWLHWRARYKVAGKTWTPDRNARASRGRSSAPPPRSSSSGSASASVTAGSDPTSVATTVNPPPSTMRIAPSRPCSESGARWASTFLTAEQPRSAASSSAPAPTGLHRVRRCRNVRPRNGPSAAESTDAVLIPVASVPVRPGRFRA
jgi:hypothetical protein